MVPSPQLYDSLVSFSEMLETLQNTDGALYQLALEHEGDTSNALWDISSVKIVRLAIIYFFTDTSCFVQCHLDKASSETLILHLLNTQNYNPLALDYFVSPIPHDGSCREPHISEKGPTPSISLQSFADKIQHLNSTILLRRPDSPPLYVLSPSIY
jgi:ER membrane protein complex subunit 10